MFEVNEYIPKGGWVKYRKRKERKEKIYAWLAAIFLVACFAVVGYIERGI